MSSMICGSWQKKLKKERKREEKGKNKSANEFLG